MQGITSLDAKQYKTLPKLIAPAGYVCLLRDVGYGDRFALLRVQHPSEVDRFRRKWVFQTQLEQIFEAKDAARAERHLRQRYSPDYQDWFELNTAQLREFRNLTGPQQPRLQGRKRKRQPQPPRDPRQRRHRLSWLTIIILLLIAYGAVSIVQENRENFSRILGYATPSYTPSPTATTTSTSTPTNTLTATATSTSTPTNTPTATATSTSTPTNTPTATATSTNTPTNTPTATATATPTATSSPAASLGFPLTRFADPLQKYTHVRVNLRTGPGTEYRLLETVPADTALEVIGQSGDWYLIRRGGREVYIAGWLTHDAPLLRPSESQGSTSQNVAGNAPIASEAEQSQTSSPPVDNCCFIGWQCKTEDEWKNRYIAFQNNQCERSSQPEQANGSQLQQPLEPQFSCNCSKTCGQMSSCSEAYFQLNSCGCGRRDGDKDGIPCESICP